jgi:hypothetical protein
MGMFLSVSAIRARTVEEVAAAIRAYAASQDVDVAVTREAPDEETDATVSSREGWTVIFWPMDFLGGNETISQALSGSLQTLVSSVDVYDGDHWYHFLFRDGEVLDRFCSYPGYFTADPEEKEQRRHEWRSDPEVIAAQVGVPLEVVRPYLVDVELLPQPPRKGVIKRALRWLGATSQVDPDELSPKAFPDDEATLGDIWVFADFWRRLGISYEGAPGDRERRVRFPNGFNALSAGES